MPDIYVAPGARGSGAAVGSPADLTAALAAAVSPDVVHMASGTYSMDAFTIATGVTLTNA